MYVARSSARVADDFGSRLERLGEEGFEVHVLAGPDGGFEELVNRGIHCRSIPVVYRQNVPGLVGAFFIIQAYFIEQRPILVHAHDGVLAWMGALAASRAGCPAIFATFGEHGFERDRTDLGAASVRAVWPRAVEALENRIGGTVGRLAAPIAERGREWMVRHVGRMVDRYVVTDDRTLEELQSREWVEEGKLERVIGGTGLDIDTFDPDRDDLPSSETVRADCGVPDECRFVVGHAGPLRADRNGLDVLRLLERLGRRRRDVGALFTADARESELWDAGAPRRRIGPARDDPAFYAAIDLLVHPGRGRSGAKDLMRAQAMRVPVAAYDSATNASVVADGQTGMLVPPGDLDSLVETVAESADHQRQLRDLGRRARTRAVKRFDQEHIESQILRLYDTILEQKLQT